jgi:hypothetical protein
VPPLLNDTYPLSLLTPFADKWIQFSEEATWELARRLRRS